MLLLLKLDYLPRLCCPKQGPQVREAQRPALGLHVLPQRHWQPQKLLKLYSFEQAVVLGWRRQLGFGEVVALAPAVLDGEAKQVDYLLLIALKRAQRVVGLKVAHAGFVQQVAPQLGKRQGPPPHRLQPLHKVKLAKEVKVGGHWVL